MIQAAKALIKTEYLDIPDDPDQIVREFRTRFYDTQKFFDPFAGGKFAHYLFAAHKRSNLPHTQESAHHLIEGGPAFHRGFPQLLRSNADASELLEGREGNSWSLNTST